MNENLSVLRKKAMSLPTQPGVYLMKNKTGKIIYVGKAKALKNRVSSYFGSPHNHTAKVRSMVEHVADFDFIICGSEFEALVLECSLIKRYSPKYNILLKDAKGYHYIKISHDGWGSICSAMRREDDGAEYLGPYTSAFVVRQSVDDANKIYRLPQCGKEFPRDCGKSRPCLNFFISQCSAPCAGKIKYDDYKESFDSAVAFLKGGGENTLSQLQTLMDNAAENLEFEKAARYRDRISAINRVAEKQKVVSASVPEQDVFSLALSQEKACLMVLRFSAGKLCDSEHFLFDAPENLPDARYELLAGYYSIRDRVPPRITVDGEVTDGELLCDWLSEKAGRRVTMNLPSRGEQKELLEMCRSNAAENLALSLGRHGSDTAALDELARLLGLAKPPEYIESFDISHTAGSENVAGMVVFKNGQPLRSAYKRFKIRDFEGQDDCASMAQAVSRRMQHYLDGDGDEGFARLPDLLLLDGAQAQVHAVSAVLSQMKIDVPVFGMVKDSHHRTRAVTTGGAEIAINSKRRAFTLVSSIQEEVHRFSVSYHRRRRSMGIASSLTQIDGIGEARAKALLKSFRSITAIKEASVEELSKVKGVSKAAAQAVFDFYH